MIVTNSNLKQNSVTSATLFSLNLINLSYALLPAVRSFLILRFRQNLLNKFSFLPILFLRQL